MADPKVIWDAILVALSSRVSKEGFSTWLAPTRGIELNENVLLVEVPNPFFVDWIGQYYAREIEEALRETAFESLTVTFKPLNSTERRPLAARKPKIVYAADGSKLQERYTFATFVTGESNKLAHAAALAVAEAPAQAYNPLFIYGGTGLGKTHLMQAIGNHARKTRQSLRIYYTAAENIFIELIDAIEKDKRMEFKNKYRSKDLLLIDDIHYLKGKESLQEEIFHTFNYLYDAGRQIVIASDRPPKEIPTLEERLASRFSGGLVVDIQPPDLEMRMAILRRKAEQENVSVSPDVAYYIASRVRSNIRELEGSLIRLLAISSLSGREVSVPLAEEVLKDLLGPEERVTKDEITRRVSKEFGISVAEMKSRRRTQELALARQVAMYLMRSTLDVSLKEIGEFFGGKDHTTVIHACEKVSARRESDEVFAERLRRLTRGIASG